MFRSLLIYLSIAAAAVAIITVYLLPVLIGWIRHVRDLGSLAVINVLLGWTLLGWAVALAMALRSTQRAAPAGYFQGLPPPAPPPDAGRYGPPGPPPLRLPPRPHLDLAPRLEETPDAPGDAGEEQS